MRRAPKPDPVPPPKEWKTRKPCRPEQLSATRRTLSKNLVNELLSDGVVTTGVVVGGILLSSDHQLGVEQTAVGAGADLIDDVGLEIAVDGARDIFALT